jgi:hypothetical protein
MEYILEGRSMLTSSSSNHLCCHRFKAKTPNRSLLDSLLNHPSQRTFGEVQSIQFEIGVALASTELFNAKKTFDFSISC